MCEDAVQVHVWFHWSDPAGTSVTHLQGHVLPLHTHTMTNILPNRRICKPTFRPLSGKTSPSKGVTTMQDAVIAAELSEERGRMGAPTQPHLA